MEQRADLESAAGDREPEDRSGHPPAGVAMPGDAVPDEPGRSSPPRLSWRAAWRRLWRAPDPNLVEAGVRGEWLVASCRLLIVVLLIYIPLDHFFKQPERGRQIVAWLVVVALTEALLLYSAVRRSWGRHWIGFFSGSIDVSLVTLSLLVFLRLNEPLEAVNNLVIFPVYFLAIGATSLRYDWRICILSGLTAVLQYLGLLIYAVWQWDLDDPLLAPELSQSFSWTYQSGRLILLALATMLATTLVLRSFELRRLSTRDRLTLLANRGLFDESLERMEALALRSGDPVTVAMIDVDHFKKFNDTYGHLAGDAALRLVARTLARSVRTTDLVARYGGEEFSGLFPGMKASDAQWRLEDLRREIETLPIVLEGRSESAYVTISVGVAVWPGDGATLEEALEIADGRLYRAKKGGRNRIVTPKDDSGLPVDSARPVLTSPSSSREPQGG
jgi:diguanylate cyclase (GGDEF)-like protein